MHAEIEWEVPGGGTHCWLVDFDWIEGEGAEVHSLYYAIIGGRYVAFEAEPKVSDAAWDYITDKCRVVYESHRIDRAKEAL